MASLTPTPPPTPLTPPSAPPQADNTKDDKIRRDVTVTANADSWQRARTPRSSGAAHARTTGAETAASWAWRGRGRAAAAVMLPSYPPRGSASSVTAWARGLLGVVLP